VYSIDARVAASHTDEKGWLKLVSAIDMLQDCSQLWLESEPALEKFFSDNNMVQFLVSRQLDVIRPPLYGERLRVKTSVYECRNVYGFRNSGIYDEAGKPCFLCWAVGAFVNTETGRPSRLSREVLESLTIDPKIEMEYLDKRIVIPESTAVRTEEPIKVKRQDIDFNRHMNNARYVDYAVEYLPPRFEVKRLRIEYKLPSVYGERLYPQVIEEDEKIVVVFNDEGNNTKALMEFTGGTICSTLKEAIKEA
jgi:acyl-ACP thioesterase